SVDVIDLLPAPIWHIIFRLLLAHHSPENRGDSSAASQEAAPRTPQLFRFPPAQAACRGIEALRPLLAAAALRRGQQEATPPCHLLL
ncbi:unnamed protein product, partial [Closterium sp. Naga37s-1]